MGWEEWVIYLTLLIGSSVSMLIFVWGCHGRRRIPAKVLEQPGFDWLPEDQPACGGELTLEAPDVSAFLLKLKAHLENPYHGTHNIWNPSSKRGRIVVTLDPGASLIFRGEGLIVGEGVITAASEREGWITVRYVMTAPGLAMQFAVGKYIALVGFLAALGVPALFIFYVWPMAVQAGQSAQALQVLQVCHLIWPPALVLGQARTRLRLSGDRLETILEGAAYELRTGQDPLQGPAVKP